MGTNIRRGSKPIYGRETTRPRKIPTISYGIIPEKRAELNKQALDKEGIVRGTTVRCIWKDREVVGEVMGITADFELLICGASGTIPPTDVTKL